MRVFLHIGAPKTGTSAIQYFMNSNRDQLEALGFYYPEHPLDLNQVSGGHTQLGMRLVEKDRDRARQVATDWLREAEERRCHLVLSAESFYGFFDELAELFADCSVDVIAYYRDPLESLISNHNQVVKRHFETRALDDYLAAYIGRPAHGISGEVLFKWRARFGAQCLHVCPYSKSAFPEGNIEYSFLSLLGLGAAEWGRFSRRPGKINTSYTEEALELKRMLNQVLRASEPHLNAQIDWAMQKYSDDANNTDNRTWARGIEPDIAKALSEQFYDAKKRIIEGFISEPPVGFYEKISDVISLGTALDGGSRLKKIVSVWESIKQNLPEVSGLLEERVERSVKQVQAPFAVFRLADVMGLPYSEPKTNVRIPEPALRVFKNEQSGVPDFLRELTKMLVDQGRDEDALVLIRRARELRPQGPAIVRLYDEIAARLGIES